MSLVVVPARQAEQLVFAAAAAIPDFERQIKQQEDSISILLGRNPGPIVRETSHMTWPEPEEIPAGIPSQLLERRPDIQHAEAQLVAANANVGAAKAQLFPQLSLSATGGTSSSQLQGLVDGKNLYWYGVGNLTQPIFDAGRLRNNLRLTEAPKQEQSSHTSGRSNKPSKASPMRSSRSRNTGKIVLAALGNTADE